MYVCFLTILFGLLSSKLFTNLEQEVVYKALNLMAETVLTRVYSLRERLDNFVQSSQGNLSVSVKVLFSHLTLLSATIYTSFVCVCVFILSQFLFISNKFILTEWSRWVLELKVMEKESWKLTSFCLSLKKSAKETSSN